MGDLSLRSAARWTTRALLLVLFNFISAAPMAVVSAQDSAVTSPTPTVASTDDTVPIFVKFRSGTAPSEIDAAMRTTGGLAVREHPQLRLHLLRVPAVAKEAILTGYKKHPAVEWAEAAHRVTEAGSPNEPLYAQQWSRPKISWDKAYGGVPILGSAKIAVLDTGIDATHPDLLGRVSPGQSFVGGLPDIDSNGHGTAMAGIAAANVNNMIGIAGVAYAGASLSSVRVLGADGSGWDSDVVSGVLWAADNGAKVILMGFSSPDFSSSLQDAVNYAWSKGAVLVAATGNDGSTAPTYPAGMANVIGVAATNQNDAVAPASNTGSASVAAPGVGVYATQPGGGYASLTGSSASAAETAGRAALLVASGKNNSGAANQIRGAVDPVSGQTIGRINMYSALTTVAAPQPTPTPAPTPTPGPSPTYRPAAAQFSILGHTGVGNSNTVNEGNSGTTSAQFDVILSGAGGSNCTSTSPCTINYATSAGSPAATGGTSCATNGVDYLTTSGTLTFNSGNQIQTLPVIVCADLSIEPDETFVVTISNASGGATIQSSQKTAIGTIIDDDGAQLVIDDVSASEGNTGTTNFTFHVSFAVAQTHEVRVNYATAPGPTNPATASANCGGGATGYISDSGTLPINAGVTSTTIVVKVCSDTTPEPNQTFVVNLTNAFGATISDSQGLGTIIDDDNTAPTVTRANASVTVNEGQTAANTGTYADTTSGDSVAITASVGTATKTGTSSGTWSWSFLTNDGPVQSQTVTITATDSFGATATTTFALTVANVAPTATFNAPASVNEGSAIALSLTAAGDPSSSDTTAGFQYAFDCGEGSGYGVFGSSNSASCPTTDNGSRTATGQIKDKDGGAT